MHCNALCVRQPRPSARELRERCSLAWLARRETRVPRVVDCRWMVLLASPRLALQAGTIAGVYIDKLLPPWMLTMLLTVALIFIASKTARRACDRRLVCAVLSMDIARTTGRLTGVWGWLSTPSLCQSSHCGVPCAVGCGARTQRGWLSVPSRSVLSALPPTLPAVAAETRRPAGVVVVAAAAARRAGN
jgi:hypothetical protein